MNANLSKIHVVSLIVLILLVLPTLFACVSQDSRILQGGSQVQLRSIQTRAFDTNDRQLVARNIIATLQDLSFVIDKADLDLGTITATKLGGYQIRMTVTVRPRSESQLLVRASAQYNLKPIEDPQPYQDFFNALGKSLFLAVHEVE